MMEDFDNCMGICSARQCSDAKIDNDYQYRWLRMNNPGPESCQLGFLYLIL